MKKTFVLLMLILIFCGCFNTTSERAYFKNVHRISGVVSNFSIEKGIWQDNVIVEFKDGRTINLIRKHNFPFIVQREMEYTIGYSPDNKVIFWVTMHRKEIK